MVNHIVYNMDKAKKIWHKNIKEQRKEKKRKENEVYKNVLIQNGT